VRSWSTIASAADSSAVADREAISRIATVGRKRRGMAPVPADLPVREVAKRVACLHGLFEAPPEGL
jgi:hypothetical protein